MSADVLTPNAEIWKPINDEKFAALYSVSSLGNVSNTLTGRILTKTLAQSGYYAVALRASKRPYWRSVHSLVAAAFLPKADAPYGLGHGYCQIDHKDGNKLNNAPSNLHYVTPTEHNNLGKERRQFCHGDEHRRRVKPFLPRGERHGMALIDASIVKAIRKCCEEGISQREVGRLFWMDQKSVWEIKKRITWESVP